MTVKIKQIELVWEEKNGKVSVFGELNLDVKLHKIRLIHISSIELEAQMGSPSSSEWDAK